ncbi:MAG: hypothetical protein B7Y45_07885 [Sphingomonas sp. 28-66-16]|nr:MAG: hypothetical protein B7Y45_07885 [Sphingomonas sp. 28-66-16]
MQHGIKRVLLAAALALVAAGPASSQVRTVDPDTAIDSDLARRNQQAPAPDSRYGDPVPAEPLRESDRTLPDRQVPDQPPLPDQRTEATQAARTYQRRDLFTAAENVFGKGAEGLGGILERILADQGEPTAYIAGREASGAILVGLRYGSGILSHRIEGDRPIFWTGPSIGFDAGGNASKIFVLVYNLYDSQDIFRRFPEGEGHLYLVGGFSATYLRRGKIVLIPIRLGVGLRAGVNLGYMKFRPKAKWMPF